MEGMVTKTAFVCSTCGAKVEAMNPTAYRLMSSGHWPIKCAACLDSHDNYSSMTLEEYYETERWKEKAKECRCQADHRCRICDSDGLLHAHHRTYDRLKNELPNDLTAVCKPCHIVITAMQRGLIDIDDLARQLSTGRIGKKRPPHGSIDFRNYL